MRRSVMLCGQAQDKCDQDEADGSLLLRRENKNLATQLFSGGPLHSARGLT
jgi:hypothetical protein